MSEVNVQIQNPQQTVNINNPSIVIEIPTDSIEVEILEGQPIEIQVQSPVIEVNIGGPCNCPDGGGGTWGSITGNLEDQTDIQTALDGKAASSHTHPLSDITQSGATLNQIPKWNGSAWVPADESGGPGGSASITDITYADMETALAGATLTKGQFYRITDAAGTDLGFICQAVTTNEITVNGTGGYLNADFQAAGDYANTPVTFGTQLGIWRTGFEAVTIAYTGATGIFAVGDTITGSISGATAVIVTDDGSNNMTAYMTSAGIAFDNSDVLDNGNGVTADMDGAATSPTIVLGDVVIWNLTHYQLTDATLLDGTDPATNTAAYTLLDKATYPETYVTAWDLSEFDFPNAWLQYGQDLRGNKVRYEKAIDDNGPGYGFSIISRFHFGRADWTFNDVENGWIDDVNGLVIFKYNKLRANVAIASNITEEGSVISLNTFNPGSYIYGVTLGAYSQIQGNTFSENAYIENVVLLSSSFILDNLLLTGAAITESTLSDADRIQKNTISQGAVITALSIGGSTTIENNILENAASLTGITAGAGCIISGNTIGPGGVLGEDTVIGDTVQILNNVIYNNGTLGRIVSGPSTIIANNVIQQDGGLYEINAGENCRFMTNTVSQGALLGTDFIAGDSTEVNDNILGNGASLTGITAGANCSVSRNEIGQGATLGGTTTMGDGANIDNNVIGAGSDLSSVSIGVDSIISNNILENGASLTDITAGANCEISRNKVGQGATLGGSTTMGDGAQLNDNTIGSFGGITELILGASTIVQSNTVAPDGELTAIETENDCTIASNIIQNGGRIGSGMYMASGAQCSRNTVLPGKRFSGKTLGSNVLFNDNTIGVIIDVTETISDNIEGKRAIPGFSDVPATLDITGLTALDFTAAWAQYRGIYNLTSSNATETISADSLTNFPTAFPFRLVPASGLALTLTCTAAASATNGSIVGSAGTIVLDGTNGDWVELEADSTGTFVRVKNLQVYS